MCEYLLGCFAAHVGGHAALTQTIRCDHRTGRVPCFTGMSSNQLGVHDTGIPHTVRDLQLCRTCTKSKITRVRSCMSC